MKQYLGFFAAVLSAIVVGLFGYERYKVEEVKQDQGYRTAAYLSQSMQLVSPMKSVTGQVWQMTGELPCTANEYAAGGFRPPEYKANSSMAWVEVTGCGEFALDYSEFDGTPPGQIVTSASVDLDGTSVSWTCTSPSYESIEDYFPWCRYVKR
jgi:hypothetical protein